MKYIIDADNIGDVSMAVNALLLAIAQSPNLEIGTEITIRDRGAPIKVVRNKDSWTARVKPPKV
jgi:hypothetical protein